MSKVVRGRGILHIRESFGAQRLRLSMCVIPNSGKARLQTSQVTVFNDKADPASDHRDYPASMFSLFSSRKFLPSNFDKREKPALLRTVWA